MYNAENELDVSRFFKGLVRYRKIGIMVFIAVLTLSVFGNHLLFPDKYEAKSTVRFQSNAFEDQRTTQINILREEVLGRSILTQVIADLDLTAVDQSTKSLTQTMLGLIGIESQKRNINVDSLVNWLAKSVIVEEAQSHGQGDIFVLSLADDDPQLITDIVNSIVENYIATKHVSKADGLKNQVSFLRVEIAKKKAVLDKAKYTILRFKDQNSELLARADNIDGSLQAAKTDYISAQSRHMQVDLQLKTARRQLAHVNPTSVAAAGQVVDEASLSPQELYYKVQSDLDNVQFKFSSEHPIVKRLQNKLARLERTVGKNPIVDVSSSANPEYIRMQGDVYSLEAQQAALITEVDMLGKEVANLQRELILAPNIIAKLSVLESNAEDLKDEYDGLKVRLTEASMGLNAVGNSAVGSNFNIVDMAVVPTVTVFGSRMKYYVMGFVLALVLGVGSIFGIVILFNKSSDELDNAIGTINENTSTAQNTIFYGAASIALLANIAYIVSHVVSQSIVIV